MSINLPSQVRAALYVITALGSPIVAYLAAKEIIGDVEVSFWSALTTAVAALAAYNLAPDTAQDSDAPVKG